MADNHERDFSLQELAVKVYGHELPPKDLRRFHDLIQEFPDLLDLGRSGIPIILCLCRDLQLQQIRRIMEIDLGCLHEDCRFYSNLFLHIIFWISGTMTIEMRQAKLDLLEQMLQARPSLFSHKNYDVSFNLNLMIKLTATSEVVGLVLRHAPHFASQCDSLGRLPLHIACSELACSRKERFKTEEWVVDAISDLLFMKDDKVLNPLLHDVFHYYKNNGKAEVIRLLVNAYPDAILVKDNDSKTPFQVACQRRLFPMELIQLMANAKPEALSIQCGRGMSPFHTYILNNQQSTKTGIVTMMRLHMIHGYQDLLVNLDGRPNGSERFLAAAINLVKREHLARKELDWMNMVKELAVSLPRNSSEAAAVNILWLWLKEHWNIHRTEIEFIEAKLKTMSCY